MLLKLWQLFLEKFFLPRELQGLAYCDTNLIVGKKELRSPMFTAKLVEALTIKSNDNILKLGLESGYPIALIARLCKSVELIDYDEQSLTLVRRQLANIDIYNVEFNNAEHITNIIKNGKKIVYISNVVKEDEIDESLLGLLETNGRLIFVVRTAICDKAYLITKIPKQTYEKSFLFNTYNK